MKIIYCDGSSLGNPGRGGWGVVAIDTEKKLVWEYGEKADVATNNQMELSACIFALKLILKSSENLPAQNHIALNKQKPVSYELRLDSKYVIQGVTEWMSGWVKNSWKNSQKKPVLNKELWQEILQLKNKIDAKKVKLIWTHVYGHSGEEWNERVDEIARYVAAGEKIILRKGEKY
jgi:ribonuclease HI